MREIARRQFILGSSPVYAIPLAGSTTCTPNCVLPIPEYNGFPEVLGITAMEIQRRIP